MDMHFLPYGRQVIEDDDIQAVIDVLKGDYLTTGPSVDMFERDFAKATNAKEAVVCGNATQALHLACVANGLSAGESAIVPSLTFLATANAVRYTGADVFFADVDSDTGLMTPESFKAAINRSRSSGLNPKVVLPVHLAGQMVEQEEIQSIAQGNNIAIITDSCHALGSIYKNTLAGECKYEDMSVFSFHPVKTIAMGEGGAITVNDSEMAKHLRTLRGHGMVHRSLHPNLPDMGLDEDGNPNPWYYEMLELGYNYRESDIHCALGISQLKKLKRFIQRRQELVALYDELIASLFPRVLPPVRVAECAPSWHLYAVRIDFKALGKTRASIMNSLKHKNIGTQVHYMPVHQQPYYRNLYGVQNLPGADNYYSQTLSLPLFPSMTDDNVRQVVGALEEELGQR